MTEQEKMRLDEILQQAAMQLIKAQTYLRTGQAQYAAVYVEHRIPSNDSFIC